MTRISQVLVAIMLMAGLATAQAPDLSRLDIVLRSIPDGPVARVDQETIAPDEFRDLYLSEVARVKTLARSDKDLTDVERITLAMNALRVLIERSILFQEATKAGISVPDAELIEAWDKELQTISRGLTPEGSAPLTEEQVLEKAGATREEALRELRRALVINKMREKIMIDKNIRVTDEEIDAEIAEQGGLQATPDSVHLQQLFVRPTAATPEAKAKAREKAETALGRIQSGQTFEAVTREVSDGPYRENGGDIGHIPLGALPDALRAAVTGLAPGEMSGVVESQHGFHVARLIEAVPGKVPERDEVAPFVEGILMNKKGNVAIREFCAEATQGREIINVYLGLENEIAARPELRRIFEEIQGMDTANPAEEPA
jgi:hypothetical protein